MCQQLGLCSSQKKACPFGCGSFRVLLVGIGLQGHQSKATFFCFCFVLKEHVHKRDISTSTHTHAHCTSSIAARAVLRCKRNKPLTRAARFGRSGRDQSQVVRAWTPCISWWLGAQRVKCGEIRRSLEISAAGWMGIRVAQLIQWELCIGSDVGPIAAQRLQCHHLNSWTPGNMSGVCSKHSNEYHQR